MTHTHLALACTLAPLGAFWVVLLGLRQRHALAAAVVLAAGAVAMVTSVALAAMGPPPDPVVAWPWITVKDMPLAFGFLLDGRSLLMGAIVGVIAFCIQVYSLGYMADDPGRGRFFAFMALFEWSMLSFVYAPNLLQGFIFWELVGLASFLLIGFWYHKPSAVAAAKKAFLMTRIGDIGLFIGLILLFEATGTLEVLGIGELFAADGLPRHLGVGQVEVIAALLFVGIIGKSAQFPLHTWLPDAMEGPTPVSALLHSATMVAAGVFLFARFHELFMDAPATRMAALTIATFTAILASTMAVAAKDMKRILAFSSISQLGFMLMGLAAGSLFAGMFHLTTHAAFKALLFLTAGAYMHQVGSIDIVTIGRSGAARKLVLTTVTMLVGAAALAGVPGLAGFYSKESVLHALHGPESMWFLGGALVASFLTAYYTSRMVFLLTRGNPDSPVRPADPDDAPAEHGHAPGWAMKLPMAFLAVGAFAAGWFGGPIAGLLGVEQVHPSLAEMAPAIGVVALGIGLAWFDFGRRAAPQTGAVARWPGLLALLEDRWRIDALYRKSFIASAEGTAGAMYEFETRGLDATSDGLAVGTRETGRKVARVHIGHLPVYLAAALVTVAAFVLQFWVL